MHYIVIKGISGLPIILAVLYFFPTRKLETICDFFTNFSGRLVFPNLLFRSFILQFKELNEQVGKVILDSYNYILCNLNYVSLSQPSYSSKTNIVAIPFYVALVSDQIQKSLFVWKAQNTARPAL